MLSMFNLLTKLYDRSVALGGAPLMTSISHHHRPSGENLSESIILVRAMFAHCPLIHMSKESMGRPRTPTTLFYQKSSPSAGINVVS